ncbi:MAG: hypothetical protein OXI24_17280, partial [Candidatus Poribacteria bacterium]|nr:hypothetical protein [Candidatus Poribacteria bacterium]
AGTLAEAPTAIVKTRNMTSMWHDLHKACPFINFFSDRPRKNCIPICPESTGHIQDDQACPGRQGFTDRNGLPEYRL